MGITLPGTGQSVATEDIGGEDYQLFKMAAGTAAATEPIGADDKGSYQAFWVVNRPNDATQSQDSSGLTIASTNYIAGDVLGAGWTFTSMARANGEGGYITSAVLLDDGDVITNVDLYIASATITFGTDNAAPSVSDADALKIHGLLPLTVVDMGTSRLAVSGPTRHRYFCDATSLFVYARAVDANNFFTATDDLHLRLFYELI